MVGLGRKSDFVVGEGGEREGEGGLGGDENDVGLFGKVLGEWSYDLVERWSDRGCSFAGRSGDRLVATSWE